MLSPRARVVRFAAATVALLAFCVPASAQGFLDMIFNGDRYAPRSVPQQARPYADPGQSQYGAPSPAPSQSAGTGRAVSYCVRLCDGRFFPMHRQGNASAAQLCSSFCPAAKTQVFNGSAIDHAYAGNGARYADLDNAFVYREKVIAGCTCNGKDPFGLARIDVNADPTLRPGDIVASGDNVKAALIAAAAAKERGAARDAAAEPAPRGVRRAALPAGVTRVSPPAAEEGAQAEPTPED